MSQHVEFETGFKFKFASLIADIMKQTGASDLKFLRATVQPSPLSWAAQVQHRCCRESSIPFVRSRQKAFLYHKAALSSNLFSTSFTFNSRKIHWSNSKLEEVAKGQMKMPTRYHTSNFFSESQCIRGFLLSSKSDSRDWIYANCKVKIIRDRSKV